MIGAIMAKRMARSSFDLINRREITKLRAGYAENVTWNFPGNTPISGEMKGKKAVEAAFAKMCEQFPKMQFTVKDVFVSNISALGGTNNIAVEYEVIKIPDGEESRIRGVSIIRVKGGKVVEQREYIFNIDVENEAWRRVSTG
jgi:ketosteroid isomerase-like protein